MASPVVSACAALMYTVNPNITVNQVKDGLYSTAYDLSSSGWDQYTGYGDVDVEGAVWAAVQTRMPESVTAKTALYGYDDVKVTWAKVSGAEGYRVYYKKSTSKGDYSYLKQVSSATTSYSKKDLADGVKYEFIVVPVKKLGSKTCEGTGYSSSIYTLKKISTPSVKKASKNYVTVKWTNISGESGYQISKSTKKSGTSIVSTYKTTSGKYKKLKVTRNKTYYYKVRAYRTVGSKKIYGPWSSPRAYKLK